MRRTIDYSFIELSDGEQGESLLGFEAKTVRKIINELEKECFKGYNIFRNRGAKSDFLFRYEIKDLALFLIWLELSEPFKDGKVKKSGVSEKSIEKLIGIYNEIGNADFHNNYEEYILLRSYNFSESRELAIILDEFQNALTNFLLLVVKNYSTFTSNFFKDVTNQLNAWSNTIIAHALFYKTCEECNVKQPKLEKPAIVPNTDYVPLQFSIKSAVVDAIKTIASVMYDFDENGICKRKSSLPIGDEKLKCKYEDLLREYRDVFKDDKSIEESPQERICDARKQFEEFLNQHWKLLFADVKMEQEVESGLDGKINRFINSLKTSTCMYINDYCCIKGASCGYIQVPEGSQEMEQIFHRYEGLKIMLYNANFPLTNLKYGKYLQQIEKDVWTLYIQHGQNLEDEMVYEPLESAIDAFRRDSYEVIKRYRAEFHANVEEHLRNTSISAVSENAEEIHKLCERITNNLFSMILRAESEAAKNKKNEG